MTVPTLTDLGAGTSLTVDASSFIGGAFARNAGRVVVICFGSRFLAAYTGTPTITSHGTETWTLIRQHRCESDLNYQAMAWAVQDNTATTGVTVNYGQTADNFLFEAFDAQDANPTAPIAQSVGTDVAAVSTITATLGAVGGEGAVLAYFTSVNTGLGTWTPEANYTQIMARDCSPLQKAMIARNYTQDDTANATISFAGHLVALACEITAGGSNVWQVGSVAFG